MEKKEIDKIKQVLDYVLIARKAPDFITLNMMFMNEAFVDEVIKPLQEICGWNEADEERVTELVVKFTEETKGHSPQERGIKIAQILAISGGIAAAIAGGIVLKNCLDNQKTQKNAE